MDNNASHEVFFTFVTVGASTKITAIDSKTGREVCVIAPTSLQQSQMQTLALNKLQKMIASSI